jgi:hypothetical protein
MPRARRSLPHAVAAFVVTGCVTGCVPPSDPSGHRPLPSVDAARELDQLGVRSFREGRFADAVIYFRAAFDRGGPPTELWNLARAEERRDDLEAAEGALAEYVARGDLAPVDRGEAERELQALRARASTLTVTTTPEGATLTLDGKTAPGVTPLSLVITPGDHTVRAQKPGFAAASQAVKARLGRALAVSLDLPATRK